MNKIASKQRQSKTQPAKLKEKKVAKKACRCSPTRTSRKSAQSKVTVRNHPKIKKVINNIRSMCGDGSMQNSSKELHNKNSDQSVIYVGTYPKQSCPVIDLTISNSSLEVPKECYRKGTRDHQQLRTLYLSSLRNNRMKYLPRPSKPTSLVNLPVVKNRIIGRNCLQLSSSSIMLNEHQTKLYKRIAALDLPCKYQGLDMTKDYGVDQRIRLDSYDINTMDMILDIEDDYQLFIKGKFHPNRIFDSNTGTEDLINRYLLDNRE